MADTVKMSVLDAIRDAVDKVDGIGSAFQYKGAPIARETVKFPVAFIFEDEERKEQQNRYSLVTMPINVDIQFDSNNEEERGDDADRLAAAVEIELLSNFTIMQWCKDIRPDPASSAVKYYENDFLGGVLLRYIVQFRHIRGDPYTK